MIKPILGACAYGHRKRSLAYTIYDTVLCSYALWLYTTVYCSRIGISHGTMETLPSGTWVLKVKNRDYSTIFRLLLKYFSKNQFSNPEKLLGTVGRKSVVVYLLWCMYCTVSVYGRPQLTPHVPCFQLVSCPW